MYGDIIPIPSIHCLKFFFRFYSQSPHEEVIVKIKELSPKMVQPVSEDSSEQEDTASSSSPVFQFSPEFHRVPSPIFRPEHTFIPPEFEERKPAIKSKPILESTPRIGTVSGKEIPVVQAAIIEPPQEVCRVQPHESYNPRPSTVSARAKFFEMEIQQLQQPNAKPCK